MTITINRTELQVDDQAAGTIFRGLLESMLGRADIMGAARITAAPRLGQAWEGQGGAYGALMRGQNGNPDYHIIVPTDPRATATGLTWGSQGIQVGAANDEWDGATNTTALALASTDHPAAQWAAGLEIDGHTDLYLPSRRELRILAMTVPELFKPGWYWSSTQGSADYACAQNFEDGSQHAIAKDDDAMLVRAVRRIFIR